MNYLAHARLSFNNPGLLVGNMISDFVKGKHKFEFPPVVQKGITLHRAIDEFTDLHPETKKAKEFFKPVYRLYSGAFVDVAYDHFLACDVKEFPSPADLEHFSEKVYNTLEDYIQILPPHFKQMLPYMKNQNWLYNYQFNEGLRKSFEGLVHRALYLHESSIAFSIFTKDYHALKKCYAKFFPDLKKFASEYASNLLE